MIPMSVTLVIFGKIKRTVKVWLYKHKSYFSMPKISEPCTAGLRWNILKAEIFQFHHLVETTFETTYHKMSHPKIPLFG